MSGLLSGSRSPSDSGTLHCRYRRNENPRLAQRVDHTGSEDDALVRGPSRLGGRIDHEGNIRRGRTAEPKCRREFTGMVRHCLVSARIIGECPAREIELLGDEGHQFVRKSCGAVENLRHCHARMTKQCKLESNTEAISILPPQSDQIKVGGSKV